MRRLMLFYLLIDKPDTEGLDASITARRFSRPMTTMAAALRRPDLYSWLRAP